VLNWGTATGVTGGVTAGFPKAYTDQVPAVVFGWTGATGAPPYIVGVSKTGVSFQTQNGPATFIYWQAIGS
jgi:hypothetical protein